MSTPRTMDSTITVCVRDDIAPAPKPGAAPRLVMRFQLPPTRKAWIRQQLTTWADDVERDQLSEHQRQQLAKLLRGVAAGHSTSKMIGMSVRGGQSTVRRDKWIAVDYALRIELRHRKVAPAVAKDWFGPLNKARTVEDIAQRHKNLATAEIERWKSLQPLPVWLDAVADARNQILTGAKPTVFKHSQEKLEIGIDLSEALMGPPELRTKW